VTRFVLRCAEAFDLDCADWLAHQLTDPGEFAEPRQQEATKENGPQPE